MNCREVARIKQHEVIQKDTQWREKIVYCADAGQRVHEERASNKGHSLKIGHNHALAKYLEQKIVKEHYSPDASMGRIAADSTSRDSNNMHKDGV